MYFYFCRPQPDGAAANDGGHMENRPLPAKPSPSGLDENGYMISVAQRKASAAVISLDNYGYVGPDKLGDNEASATPELPRQHAPNGPGPGHYINTPPNNPPLKAGNTNAAAGIYLNPVPSSPIRPTQGDGNSPIPASRQSTTEVGSYLPY